MPIDAVIRPESGTPVVALTAILVVAAVAVVLVISYFLYWRSGRR
jgi:hypothetical protein